MLTRITKIVALLLLAALLSPAPLLRAAVEPASLATCCAREDAQAAPAACPGCDPSPAGQPSKCCADSLTHLFLSNSAPFRAHRDGGFSRTASEQSAPARWEPPLLQPPRVA